MSVQQSAPPSTTRAQVSGHRFLQRRVEHGLVLGDIRMIHDPLATRRRAVTFGLIAAALLMAGSALMAWLRPAADPGDASIWQTPHGALYVLVDDRAHPVPNLTSARLIAGTPEEPARIGEDRLAEVEKGAPLGIHPAPLLLGDAPASPAWAACADGEGVTVLAGTPTNPLGGHRGVVAVGAGKEWVLTTAGRAELPHPESPDGRIFRRALGIDADTPRWEPAPQVLGAVGELAPLRLPDPLPEAVMQAGQSSYTLFGEAITRVSDVQARILLDAGVPARDMERSELAHLPDAILPAGLPAIAPHWVDPAEVAVCADEHGLTTTHVGEDAPVVEVPGDGVADFFAGGTGAAVAVDTGFGYHVVDATGIRHRVPDRETLEILGFPEAASAPWNLVRLLPEGPDLRREQALVTSWNF